MKQILIFIFFSSQAMAFGLSGLTIDPSHKMEIRTNTLSPFTTDGCSRWRNGPKSNPTAWLDCCVEHDAAYWLGGTSEQRKNADDQLYQCIQKKGYPFEALIMYLGVRFGGDPLRATTYRWGYGWTRITDYHKLTDSEISHAHALYGDHLQGLKKIIQSRRVLVMKPESYLYVPNLDYTFCEEEVLLYLRENSKVPITIHRVQAVYDEDHLYHLKMKTDLCIKPLDFAFSQKTDSYTCQRDFAFSPFKNKIVKANIPSSCSMKSPQ